MKFIFTFFFSICIMSISFAQKENIYFDTDKDLIRTSEIPKLELINLEYRRGIYKIKLVGHCDIAGTEAYNLALSERRVNQVKNYLINRNVFDVDIETDYKGESQARKVAQEFRKVEIILIKKEASLSYIPKVNISKPKIEKEIVNVPIKEVSKKIEESILSSPVQEKKEEMTYNKFIESIKPKEQIFTFTGEEEHILKGDKGTIIYVPENAFVFKNGKSVQQEITFKLTEYYSKKEFVSEGLSTITDGNLLKSAGMIQLEAEAMNQTVKLAQGKDLEILFPATEEKYSTYYGERDDEGNLNWKIDKRYTRIQEDNIDNYGVTTTLDGEGLELVSKDEIKRRNKNANFNGKKGSMRAITQEEVNEAKANLAFWEAQKKERTLIQSNRLGLINCDRIIDGKNAQAIEFTVEATNEDVETISAYLILRKYNSVMKIYWVKDNTFYINARMPVGTEAQLLVTGKDKNGEFYLYEKIIKIAKKTEEKSYWKRVRIRHLMNCWKGRMMLRFQLTCNDIKPYLEIPLSRNLNIYQNLYFY